MFKSLLNYLHKRACAQWINTAAYRRYSTNDMSLPEELELIHFDNDLHISKKEQQKESKKQGKRGRGSNSKKTSYVPSDPSIGTVPVGVAQ